MKIQDGFMMREVAGNYVIISAGEKSVDFSSIITINEVGAFIWKMIDEGKNKEEIISTILKEYPIDKETAEKDFNEFTKSLIAENIIVE